MLKVSVVDDCQPSVFGPTILTRWMFSLHTIYGHFREWHSKTVYFFFFFFFTTAFPVSTWIQINCWKLSVLFAHMLANTTTSKIWSQSLKCTSCEEAKDCVDLQQILDLLLLRSKQSQAENICEIELWWVACVRCNERSSCSKSQGHWRERKSENMDIMCWHFILLECVLWVFVCVYTG